MNKRIIITVLSIAVSILLSSCTSSTTPTRGKNTQAAEYNAKLGAEYFSKGRLPLANEKLLKALAQNPSSVNANHYYALLQDQLGDTKQAEKHFKKAVRMSKRDPELHNNYGSFLCKNGEYQQAISEFSLAVQDPLYKTPEFAYTNAGVCLHRSGSGDDVEPYFRKALEINPRFGSALYQMSRLSWQLGNTLQAQAFLFRYNDVARQTPESLLLCKQIHEKLGESAESEKCVAQLLSFYPSSEEARKL